MKLITFIASAEDWAWFLRGLDARARVELSHVGEPKVYPCLVESLVANSFAKHHDVTARELPALQKAAKA